MNKKSVRDINVKGKKVLVRVDFNVPLNGREITDETRITAAMPTIDYLLDNNAKVILCSHLGRPKGEFKPEFSLAPVAEKLEEISGRKVVFAADVIGPSAKAAIDNMKQGEIVLLENLRFHKEETSNDAGFSKTLASYADIFVNDAFGTCHRAHASTVGVAAYIPAVSGFLINKELEVLGGAVDNPARPFTAMLGGAKVADKIGVIDNLINIADTLIIGGGMGYTFLKAKGFEMGKSLLDEGNIDLAAELLKKAERKGVDILLPVDAVVADEFSQNAKTMVVASEHIPADWMGLDIGPATRMLFTDRIRTSRTIIWNGPMGVFEMPAYAEGTKAMAKAMAESDAVTIIGGGDSAAAVKQMGFAGAMTHISTGGGASLEFLEGKTLPGVAALEDL
ncbi:MAG: phosphoglycerate kinase [Christensenellales bacterium]